MSSIGLRSFSNSGCKTEIETRAANASIADEEAIEYYASSNGKLVVKHTNAIFGCESKVSAGGTHGKRQQDHRGKRDGDK